MIYFVILDIVLLIFMLNIILHKRGDRALSIWVFYIIAFITLLLISGLRAGTVGTDTPMYVRVFNVVKFRNSLDAYADRFEFGYRAFNLLIARHFNEANALLFISSLIVLLFLFWIFMKESKYPWLSVVIYILLMMYYNSMCLMRQYIAISFTCVALYFLSKKKNVLFFVFLALGVSFHSSAIVVAILYPLSRVSVNKYSKYIMLFVALLFVVFFDVAVDILVNILPKYEGYIDSKYYLEYQLAAFFKAGVCISIYLFKDFIYFKHQKEEGGAKALWYKIEYYCAFLGALISTVSINGAILERMSFYFTIVNCIIIPNSLYFIHNRRAKYICSTVIVGMCLMYNLVILGFRPYWSGVIPYSFWN